MWRAGADQYDLDVDVVALLRLHAAQHVAAALHVHLVKLQVVNSKVDLAEEAVAHEPHGLQDGQVFVRIDQSGAVIEIGERHLKLALKVVLLAKVEGRLDLVNVVELDLECVLLDHVFLVEQRLLLQLLLELGHIGGLLHLARVAGLVDRLEVRDGLLVVPHIAVDHSEQVVVHRNRLAVVEAHYLVGFVPQLVQVVQRRRVLPL